MASASGDARAMLKSMIERLTIAETFGPTLPAEAAAMTPMLQSALAFIGDDEGDANTADVQEKVGAFCRALRAVDTPVANQHADIISGLYHVIVPSRNDAGLRRSFATVLGNVVRNFCRLVCEAAEDFHPYRVMQPGTSVVIRLDRNSAGEIIAQIEVVHCLACFYREQQPGSQVHTCAPAA